MNGGREAGREGKKRRKKGIKAKRRRINKFGKESVNACYFFLQIETV